MHSMDSTKRTVLWLAAFAIIGFAFMAAVNASYEGPRFDSSGYFASTCDGFESIGDWFGDLTGCKALLPSRIAVLLVGFGLALIPIYFAEKKPPGTATSAGSSNATASRADDAWGSTFAGDVSASSTDVSAASQPTAQRVVEPPITAAGTSPSQANAFKACPDCAETVRAAARKCRFCGFMFDDVTASA
jgi:hypothetical protein